MPFTVLDCTRSQLIELKQQYLCQLADAGEYRAVTGFDRDEPAWGDLAAADEIVSDLTIFNHFDGYTFTADDFCEKGEGNDF